MTAVDAHLLLPLLLFLMPLFGDYRVHSQQPMPALDVSRYRLEPPPQVSCAASTDTHEVVLGGLFVNTDCTVVPCLFSYHQSQQSFASKGSEHRHMSCHSMCSVTLSWSDHSVRS